MISKTNNNNAFFHEPTGFDPEPEVNKAQVDSTNAVTTFSGPVVTDYGHAFAGNNSSQKDSFENTTRASSSMIDVLVSQATDKTAKKP
jgi:hypothetical protein